MKTALITAFALTVAAAPLSAASLNYDFDSLSVAQQAQVFNVLNGEENDNTKDRLIKAILGGSNATPEGAAAAQVRFIEQSDDNDATRDLLTGAVLK